jgi:large repetitive protein
MRNASRLIARFGILLFALPAAGGTLPDVDAFAAAPPARRALARPAEDVARSGTMVHVEERLGVPTLLQLAQAGAHGRAALLGKAVEAPGAARAHLLDLAPLWGLDERDVVGARLVQVHDTGKGPIVVQFRQEAFGVPVFRDEMRVALNRAYEPVAVAGYLPSVAGLSEPVFTLDAREALLRALRDFGGAAAGDVERLRPAAGGYERLGLAGARRGLLAAPARAKKVLFHLPSRLEPAWYLEVDASAGTSSDLYAYVVSAADGALLYRHSLTASDSYAYRVWADASGLKMPLNGPQGRGGDPYPGATPDRWQAPFVAPSLVSLASGPISTLDPWLPPGATETNGNNVDAYADLAPPDGFGTGDFRANVTAPGVFDRTYDVTKAPDASDDQRKAAIAQLFYVTNFLHDWYYDAGFNEVAGNAQASNYGRGGVEGDGLRAEAQDYSGTDNANMSTPSDGGPPRMQMYVWTAQVRRGLAVTAPPAAVRNLNIGLASFGPQAFSVTAPVVAAADGAPPASDACDPITNGLALTGRIALVDRGTCAFVIKVANAQAAGAVGVIVVNNQGDSLVQMADSAGVTPLPYTIPSVFLGQSDGDMLKTLLSQGLTVTMGREAAVNRDGTIDTQIVAHEWAHYLSHRLIGDSNGLASNQSNGLGEGWSDFSALLLTVQAGDAALPGNAGFGGLYPMAGYVLGGGDNGFQDNTWWYFGIRRYPYSTDTTKDPLTYKHITNGVALPTTAPIAYPDDGSANAEVHNTGEVWATMLWECYAALLNDTGRLTFDQARDRMRAYFVASLKLTPVNPTLLEARDALLAVAYATDRDDHALFVRAFAKRGAGPRAAAGDRFDAGNAGAVESFDVGGDIGVASVTLDDSAAPCDRDGRLDAGETGWLTLGLRNRGLFRLAATQVALSSSNPAVSFPSGGTVNVPTTDPTQSTSVSVPVKLAAGTRGIQSLDFTLTLRDPALLADATATFTARGNADDVAASSASDDGESALTAWQSAAAAKLDASAAFGRIEVTPFDHRWSSRRRSDVADLTLTSPPLVVSTTAPFGFTFRHRYSLFVYASGTTTLYLDGGVLEISTDDGATWTDIGDSATPGYSHRLYDSSDASSPLHGARAWSGDSPSLPGFDTVAVALGSAYAGKTVRVRFRRALEFATGSNLWEIDDISFAGITNTPFPALVADRGRCRGRTIPVGSTGGTTVKKR